MDSDESDFEDHYEYDSDDVEDTSPAGTPDEDDRTPLPQNLPADYISSTNHGTSTSASLSNPNGASTPVHKRSPRLKHMYLPKCLPYETESLEEMDRRLEVIARRLLDSVKAGEWEVGFKGWSARLRDWLMLKYPMKKSVRIHLASMYYELAVMPGLEPSVMSTAASMAMTLLKPRKLISINDLRLDWRPLHDMLVKELYPKRRKAGHTNVSTWLLDMAEVVQRFFHPSGVDEMLDLMLPRLHGDDIDSILATQAFLVHFLPFSHPQKWLPVLFKLWDGINSGLWDEQMLDLLARLSVMHCNPARSDPARLSSIPHTRFNNTKAQAEILGMNVDAVVQSDNDMRQDTPPVKLRPDRSTPLSGSQWQGIRQEVGILTEREFEMVMTKCLRSMGTPVGGAMAASSRTQMDSVASKTTLAMKKPTDRLTSLAQIIVFSMAEDSPIAASSTVPSSGTETPVNAALHRVKANGLHASPSVDSLTEAGKKADAQRSYLGGSKALDHLAKLIMSCETFFHPSNHGPWTIVLTAFIQDLCYEFTKRWKDEERPECKTPESWRLTPRIKREFVLTIRTVALLSMFSKDGNSTGATRSALRSMSILEPELIIPPIIERAVPSLQGLEETHRTTAVLKALGGIGYALVTNPIGLIHLAGLLELCLPGIDMNDPGKTISTVVFLNSVLAYVRLGDLTVEAPEGVQRRQNKQKSAVPEVLMSDADEDGDITPHSPEELDAAFRNSTIVLPDWLSQFLARLFTLYEAMPEESETRAKGGATSEEQVVSMVHSCLEIILHNVSKDEAELILQQIYDYVTTTVRSNSSRVINGLVASIASALPEQVLDRFFPICKTRILAELEYGASSTRTTNTGVSVSSDATLHWYIAILYGAFSAPGRSLLKYRADIISFLNELFDRTYSENSWTLSGRLLDRVLANICTTYADEERFVNPDVWESEGFKYYHDEYWGEMYRFRDVKVTWHVPSKDEIEFGFEILDNVTSRSLDKLEQLVKSNTRDNVWHNDLCRHMSHVRYAFSSLHEFFQEHKRLKTGGVEATDYPYIPPEFMESTAPVQCGFLLTDPEDSNYVRFMAIRDRFASVLHSAACVFKQANGDGYIDGIKLTIRSIGTLTLKYGVEAKAFDRSVKAYSYLERQARSFAKQKALNRAIWIRRMELYHTTRLALAAANRYRSRSDDLLIEDLMDMSLSLFVRVRRHAQGTLMSMAVTYDGSKTIMFPQLLEALIEGIDPDVMKGSLYLLASKPMTTFITNDWRYMPKLILKLLECQHQEKPSIQALVSKVLAEVIKAIREPMTMRHNTQSKGLREACEGLESRINVPDASNFLESVSSAVNRSEIQQNEAYDSLITALINIANDPATHWRYAAMIATILRQLLRRDRPTPTILADWFMSRAIDSHPSMRTTAQGALIRLLYFIKLRTLCNGSTERLFLQEGQNPLKRKFKLENTTGDFTKQYLDSFTEKMPNSPPPAGEQEPRYWMQDKQATGWLAWGSEIIQSRLAGWDEKVFQWEEESSGAIDAMAKYVNDPEWWKSVTSQWAQEKTRQYPSADVIDILRSLCQIYVDLPFEHLRPIMEDYMSDPENKDKQRALAEMLGGLLRGSKHWPGKARQKLWDWLTPRLPRLYADIRQETFEGWKMFFEHIMYHRDPRRVQPIIDFLLENGRNCDFSSASAFEQKKNVHLVRCVVLTLAWRFTPWANEFIKLYFDNVGSDYLEVRSVIASVLLLLDNVHWHPSYPTVAALVEDCVERPEKDVIDTHGNLVPYVDNLLEKLPEWRKERPAGPKAASSVYDKTASTLMMFIATGMADNHASASFDYALKAVPEVMHMREMIDNPDLPTLAANFLSYITAVTPPIHLVEPLIQILVQTLRESTFWKIRMHALPVLSTIYYRELPLISEACAVSMMDALSHLLHDENSEVRETAAAALSGVLRCSRRASIVVLKDRFVREAKSIKLPPRRDAAGNITAEYQAKVIQLHGAILGITALIEAFPYEVPPFLPHLLTEVLAEHASDPTPISSTIRACAGNFQKTHADTWHMSDKAKFTEDQLSNLSYLISGTSYYA